MLFGNPKSLRFGNCNFFKVTHHRSYNFILLTNNISFREPLSKLLTKVFSCGIQGLSLIFVRRPIGTTEGFQFTADLLHCTRCYFCMLFGSGITMPTTLLFHAIKRNHDFRQNWCFCQSENLIRKKRLGTPWWCSQAFLRIHIKKGGM